jgi:hypothetical protein
MLRFEDADWPVSGILDSIEQRMAEAAGTLDPQEDSPGLQVAAAVAVYLAHRRDELDEDPVHVLRMATRAEFDGNPPSTSPAGSRTPASSTDMRPGPVLRVAGMRDTQGRNDKGAPMADVGPPIALIAVGLILWLAITATIGGISIQTIGLILFVIGVVWLVIELAVTRPRRTVATRERVVDRPVAREREVL